MRTAETRAGQLGPTTKLSRENEENKQKRNLQGKKKMGRSGEGILTSFKAEWRVRSRASILVRKGDVDFPWGGGTGKNGNAKENGRATLQGFRKKRRGRRKRMGPRALVPER